MTACRRHPDQDRTGFCDRCGDATCGACLALGCDRSWCPYAAPPDPWRCELPWAARRARPLAAALAQVAGAWLRPGALGKALAEHPSPGGASFGLAVGSVGSGVGLALAAVGLEASPATTAVAMAALVPLVALRLLATTAMTWVALALGGRGEPWGRTSDLVGLAAASDVLLAVPAAGVSLAAAWGAWLRYRMLTRGLGVTPLVGVAVAVTPPVLAGLWLLGGAVALIQWWPAR